ncbi:D-alanyl-D-alanine carboxypeptidase/D-alanyl-D-alanine endopeptidase [Streptosporangium carneum]|uniref:D-alanyl-D-alanine carboxypeptidase DacC n=1 Tax=Streptosporangium carneum TaxID=47481 RepID=A0A9W6MGV2_9ACTN|nr:D-alanyl-D-alanine carboxypeptidase/D-alanyl-D-alanine-endopeptidase [Streptosporangium carneum]GLK13631.1 D-alanyl-D-alanine carboxypeptidase DacC [Streptosporangium carneum]
MRPSRRATICVLLLATLAWAPFPSGAPASALGPAPGVADLVEDLDRILSDARLTPARAGVAVRSAATGEQLYALDPGKILTPASNAKLVTSAAAVDTLGLDFRFTTDVLSTGDRKGSTLTGNLYLRGTGDPTMLAADYDALAARVADAGIRVVRGGLVADDTWFDAVRLGTDWTWDDEPYYYAGQISALTASPDTDYDAGSVIVSLAPGDAEGRPAKVSTTPETGHLRIVNQATTGSRTEVSVRRPHGSDTVLVTGTVAGPHNTLVTVDDPTGHALSLFGRALARHGVRVRRQPLRQATPGDAAVVASHRSMPLSELLVPFLKLSNNMHAEILTKSIGRKVSGAGTWEAGLAAVASFARANGMPTLRLRDGSGLSRADGLTPDGVTSLLVALRSKPWFTTWYDALPIAGVQDRLVGGTLRSRMAGTPAAGNLHGKTGSMTGVTALSGYVTSADRELLVFSVMLNQFLSGSPKDIEDKIAVRLAQFSRTAPADVADVRLRQSTPRSSDLECSWLKPVQC